MRASLALSSFALAMAAPAMVPIETRSLDEIYHAALGESGTLRVAWGGDIETSGAGVIHTFERRFPGIKLNLTVDLSKYWDSRIDRTYQITGGKDDGADVAVIQSLQNFPRWKTENRVLPYKAAPWDDIYPQFVDKDGAWTGLYIFNFGPIVYNPSKLQQPMPTSYEDYLKPEWSGKLILPYPNDDDAVLYLFTLIARKYGWGFINSLAKQKIKWVRGTATPSLLIAKNSSIDASSASFASSTAFAKGVKSKPTKDIFMTWPQSATIFKSTKLPETSKLFMSFLLSDQWQKIIGDGGFATRRSFDDEGLFSQENLDPMGYVNFMQDRAQVEAWRFQFESILGPPQGSNPTYFSF